MRVGRYTLFSEIDVGGMASVHYGCLVTEGLARTVAIKRLHPQYARDPDFVRMMLAEARIASRIRHPNVVAILDVVRDESELFLVMEYVHGDTLARLVAGAKKIPVRIAIAIASNVLQGLHAAHEAKDEAGVPLEVIHRDVSPQNVMVGADGIARVLDFGIAKAAGSSGNTEQGFVRGKLRYMAPEQMMGERALTRAADVYAASAVLWEMLAGKPLFDVPEKSQLPFLVVSGAVRALPSEVPEALSAIVMRGLEKDPAKRFATALEMAEALEKEMPAASSMEIATFVKSIAKDRLEARALAVTAMEREALGHATAPVVPERTDSNAEVPLTATEPLAQARPSRAKWWIAPLAVAIGVAAFVGIRSSRTTAVIPPPKETSAPVLVTSEAPIASEPPTVVTSPHVPSSSAPRVTTSPVITKKKPPLPVKSAPAPSSSGPVLFDRN